METINKLQPNRTLHLRGFDRYGAAASLHHTSEAGWTVSGVFRDQADFAVLILWDADDYFGHFQSTKYLPDFDFSGMVLDFDIAYSGLQWVESLKYPSIDWPFLDYLTVDGKPGQIRLSDYITGRTGRANATKTFTVNGANAQPYDRVSLSFERFTWDKIIDGGTTSVTFDCYNWHGTGTVHSLTIADRTYSYTQKASDGSADVAAGLAAAAAGDPQVQATANSYHLVLTSKVNTGGTVTVSESPDGAPATLLLSNDVSAMLAKYFSDAINSTPWDVGAAVTLSSTYSGNTFTVTFQPNNYGSAADANMCALFEQHKTSTLTITPSGRTTISGAVESSSVHIRIPFDAAFGSDVTKLRQMWLTFSPKLTNASAYATQEWTAVATNWTVTDPNGKRPLKIAGAGSVRIDSRDSWVSYSGDSWADEASNQPGGTGWFNLGFARRAQAMNDSVTIRYSCQHTHDLYLGTSLYKDRGIVSVSLDGDAPTDKDLFLWLEPPLVTRRLLRSSVPAGEHVVTITVTGRKHVKQALWDEDSLGTYFYFDYLEAAVAGDVPDPAQTYAAVMPATDYDTDHVFKLSPQRVVWMLDKMGFRGALDHYLGVFWWNQRKRVLQPGQNAFHSLTVTFSGWAGLAEKLQQIKLQFGGASQGDSSGSYLIRQYLPTDTDASLAQFFCDYINETLIGVWASVSGAVLTITSRSPAYDFTFWAFSTSTDNTATFGTMAVSGDVRAGDLGEWVIDDSITPVINRAVTDWHADFWNEVHAKNWQAVASFSMELVNPPDDPTNGKVYAQRFIGGTTVRTDAGFGGLFSTQCTFNATTRAYQQQAFKEMAGLMNAAGLTPWLQFGEFLWWFFPGSNPSDTKGMAFYDKDTSDAAKAVLRPAGLAIFTWPTDDPSVNGYADANFLRGLIYTHCSGIASFVKATYSNAKFEILWPYDVNYPSKTKIAKLGGALIHYVNLPSQWMAKAGSALDRFKTEALAFGATERDTDKAEEARKFPTTAPMSWSQADTAYLMPIFNGGCPWSREYLNAVNGKAPLVNLWALDHVCLMSWPLPLPVSTGTARAL
jgi:hypothetical protein